MGEVPFDPRGHLPNIFVWGRGKGTGKVSFGRSRRSWGPGISGVGHAGLI